MSRSSLTILPATIGDLPYIVALAKRETDTIGFLPRAAYEEYIGDADHLRSEIGDRKSPKGILLARLNGEPCGFLVWRISDRLIPTAEISGDTGTFKSRRQRHVKIIQTCIQYDARRRSRGVALVGELLFRTGCHGAERVTLWCADDLEANAFWESCGFAFGGKREGGSRRRRNHNLWVLDHGEARRAQPALATPGAFVAEAQIEEPDRRADHDQDEEGDTHNADSNAVRAGGVAGFPLTSRKSTPSAEGQMLTPNQRRQLSRRREYVHALGDPTLSIDLKCDLLAAIAAVDIASAERSLSRARPQSRPQSQARRPRS